MTWPNVSSVSTVTLTVQNTSQSQLHVSFLEHKLIQLVRDEKEILDNEKEILENS